MFKYFRTGRGAGAPMVWKKEIELNFDELKRQVIAKALGQEIEHMVLHKNESIMRRHFFQIRVEKNKGKEIKMVYDKRVIVIPDSEHPHMIDTLPYGHEKLQFVEIL